MKLRFKKYVYLLNDITNAILKKDKLDLNEENVRLRKLTALLAVISVASLLLNIWQMLD